LDPEKRSVGATEREEWLRAAWHVMVAAAIRAERLVFVDEMGTNTSPGPLYPTTRKIFEAYLKQVLVPSLSLGQVMVMDNLSARKGSRVREQIEERGCELLYLP